MTAGFAALGLIALSGCSRASTNQDGQAGSDIDKGTAPAAEPFERALFEVLDAFGDDFPSVWETVRGTADDAVPIAVRFASEVSVGTKPSWDYLFASYEKQTYYVAFTRGETSVAAMGASFVKGKDWAAIPSPDDISVDASEAYGLACDLAEEEGLPKAYALYAYLALYEEQEGSGDPSYAYDSQTMTWYFEFETTQIQAETKTANDSDVADGQTGNTAQAAGSEAEDGQMFCIAVDAATGAASVILS